MEKVGVVLIIMLILAAECGAQINRARCRRSRKIPNGITKYHGKKFAMYSCNKGYELFGPEFTLCLNGEWFGPSPYCVRASCSPININWTTTNLSTVSSHNGAVVYFSCRPGYELRGNNVTFCNGEQWSSNLPTCVEVGKEPETGCDFEENFCGWMHDLNHDFDWKRKNKNTFFGHVSTGLKYDHTLGENGDGFYLYTESFSSLENDMARLISPVYNKFENGFCFRFYYHMYGEGIGSLQVYIKKESDPASLRRIDPVFTATGSQENGWLEKVIRVPEIKEYFQIIIEANKGTNIVNDIAVDDVALFDIDDCPEENVTSTEIAMTDIFDYGSCKDHCNVSQTNESCSCIDSCLNDNTCCPDYKILCLYNESDFITDYILESTDVSTTVTTIVDITSMTIRQTPTTTTTKKPIPTTTTTTTTTKKPIPITTTKKTIPITTKKTIPITTTKKPIPITTTKKPIPITTAKKPIPTTMKPTTNRTIPTIKKPIPTILTTTKTKPTTKKTIPTIKPLKPTNFENEVIKPLPTTIRTITDDFLQPTILTETDFFTEEVPQNERRVFVSHDVGKSSNVLMLSIIIGSGVVGVIVVVAAIFVVRRFRLRFRSSSKYSDSMSDVRFLAADEVLDFTMRTTDD